MNEDKLRNYSIWRFLLRSEYTIQVKIWKWLKLLNSVPFIKKTLVNQVYIRYWSFWLTFTILQWMNKNFKNGQFSSFLLRYGYAIWVKIWQWPKLLNFLHSSRKHFLIIFTFKFDHFDRKLENFIIFTALQWMKTNFEITQFEDFC